MGFLDKVIEIARKDVQKIVLPEALDPRTIEATQEILEKGIAEIILIGSEDEIKKAAGDYNIAGAEIINPSTFAEIEVYADKLAELRKKKGMTIEKARELLNNGLYLGCMLVREGYAGGMVAGAANSTADVLRPALQIVKTAPTSKLVSAAFVMEMPTAEFNEDGIYIFADCALNPDPSAEDLAHIALSSAETYKALMQRAPVVSILSFSTKGSASHPAVDKVIEATNIAKALEPDLALDGELQLDASIVEVIGKKKAPGSEVAGKANVLVFPDLNSGNIGYKLVQRFAKANAYGPLCQGLARPVNDLSRGCSAGDIVGTVALTALQAQMQKDK